MSRPPAGTTKTKLFSQHDYLAPLPLPTGEKPSDCLNIIWRKNDVFMDIGCYSIGSAVMLIWPTLLMFMVMGYYARNDSEWYIFAIGAGVMIGIPILMLVHSLFRPVPRPFRFNRQRREVCVLRDDGEYWIVPWESVVAAATQHTSTSQAGRNSMGLLFIGLENPDPDADEEDRHLSMGFNCGGGKTAMALWECVRSYMEIGPNAVPDPRVGVAPYEETQIGSIIASARKGDVLGVIHGVSFIILFNTYLAEKLQDLKLAPPPDLDHPDIIEWSKSLPPEQWAQPSPELQAAIAERHSQLMVEVAA